MGFINKLFGLETAGQREAATYMDQQLGLGHIKAVARFYKPMLERELVFKELAHCSKMVDQMQAFEDIYKANRWLGFIQGVMWRHGMRQIEDFRRDNVNSDKQT